MAKQLKALIGKRNQIVREINAFETYINSFDNSSYIELELRLDHTIPLQDTFDEIQNEIEMMDAVDAQYDERLLFKNRYYKIIAVAKKYISDNCKSNPDKGTDTDSVSSNNSVTTPVAHSVKLPVIKLREFDGSYDKWQQFRDSFEALIHNQPISDIEKFHYLQSSLKGGAAIVIDSFETSALNYSSAWELVKERFENKLLIVRSHLLAITEFPIITKDPDVKLRLLHDTLKRHLRALQNLKLPVESWDTLLIHIIRPKLDITSQSKWETKKFNSELPTMSNFLEFIKDRCEMLENLAKSTAPNSYAKSNSSKTNSFVSNNSNSNSNYNSNNNSNSNSNNSNSNSNNSNSNSNNSNNNSNYNSNNNSKNLNYKPCCTFCKGAHASYFCEAFLKLPASERIQETKNKGLCLNCLRKGHMYNDCTASTCRKCDKKHNTLLHLENTHQSNQESISSQQSSQSLAHNSTRFNQQGTPQVLLSTATATVIDECGKNHSFRLLLDPGSQSNFVTSRVANVLQLRKQQINHAVTGIGSKMINISHQAQITIHSNTSNYHRSDTYLVMDEITDKIPQYSFNRNDLQIPANLSLADPTFCESGSIDMLLGSVPFWDLMMVGQIRLGKSQPVMQQTQLGWIISGNVGIAQTKPQKSSCHLTLDAQLQRFWEIETGPPVKTFSKEEKQCQELFEQTTIRNMDGRFVVRLPLNQSPISLGESKTAAIKRLLSMEKRFIKNPSLKQEYNKFMQEYIDLGHMTKLTNHIQEHERHFFLPHHAVTNESSDTTRLRVVFDGSSKSSSGSSLNDIQLIVPTLQDDLLAIMLRFRQHTYALTGDISKMYRQILIDPEQRSLQMIVWRQNPEDEIEEYQLNTVTYGTAAASYLAIRCLQQVAMENIKRYPIASNVILNDFYVDDLSCGSNSIEHLKTIQRDVTTILQSAGFPLHKWSSNNQDILNKIHGKQDVRQLGDKNVKTLGINWNPTLDYLFYSVETPQNKPYISKRSILSNIALIFDPLGLLGPCTVIVKLILQNLWECKLSWDDPISPEIHSKWIEFTNQMQALNSIHPPRCVIPADAVQTELHGFADASQLAYGACIYIRSVNKDGIITVQLLCARSRVAPIKTISIPRLELCACLLLAQLYKKVTTSMNLQLIETFLWSDSTISLAWIKSSANLRKTFVANRVAEIQDLTNQEAWNHVPTTSNPADALSRGINPNQLQNLTIWWHGAPWLMETKSKWPNQNVEQSIIDLPETKTNTTVSLVANVQHDLFIKYSTFNRLNRVIAYCLRFAGNSRVSRDTRQYGPLTVTELKDATMCLIKISQLDSFPNEINDLHKSNIVHNKSKLITLAPFIDDSGIIRVGGRLKHSNFSYDKKHPIVLSPKHNLTKLIIKHEHIRLLHAGTQLLLASIREKYWPISGRNLVKGIVRSCLKCFRVNPRITVNPLMGELPESRTTPARAFQTCGVDYAGPFLLKDRKTRGCKIVKAYTCLFVCFSTKAVHLELVGDLTTESFIGALRRFTARRGICSHIHSDNATNFVGANTELAELAKFLESNKDKIITNLSQQGIVWHFIPPRSPHFGGIWEAGVKSTKFHIKRVLGDAKLTFEEMYTVLTQVEACLNSRPLYPMSNDPNDLTPLTPSHFLIGESLTAVPDSDYRTIKENRLSQFQRLQQLLQHYWCRWSKEYIAELQGRCKWKGNNTELLKLGALVIIKEDNLPPMRWQLARVVSVHPGNDGVTRVVSVRTSNSVVKRAVSKLCVLPLDTPVEVQI